MHFAIMVELVSCDLQAKHAAGGCPFLTASARSRASFLDTLLAAPLDVEALAGLGRRRALCPYYGARAALPEADLVLVPYGALLLEVSFMFLVPSSLLTLAQQCQRRT